jgi:hypothetical protein
MQPYRLLTVVGAVLSLFACGDSSGEPRDPLTAETSVVLRLGFNRLVEDDGPRRFTAGEDWPAAVLVESEPNAVQVVAGANSSDGAVGFPPRCSNADCPRAYIALPHDDRLNPGARNFSYGARLRLPPSQIDVGSNVVQKGRYGTSGGQWKLQVDGENARPSCVLQGQIGASRETARLVGNRGIADDEWHLVRCTVEDAKLTISIDNVEKTVQADVGTIDNDAEIRIGASGLQPTDDQFHGAIDVVFFCPDTCR